MIEEPYNGKAKLNFDGFTLSLSIPSKKNWFIIIFFTIWIIPWFQGLKSVLGDMTSAENLFVNSFLLIWIIFWTFGGLFIIGILLWTLLGYEKISIDKRTITISKSLLNLKIRSKIYDISSIKNLELNPESSDINPFFAKRKNMGEFYGYKGGKIRFDYGMKTIKFAIGIDKAEALHILNEIEKYKLYKFVDTKLKQ